MKKSYILSFFFLTASVHFQTETHLFDSKSMGILRKSSLTDKETMKLFKECSGKMGQKNPYFIIPGWKHISGSISECYYSNGDSIIISDPTLHSDFSINAQKYVINHELGHIIINGSFQHLINGYALSKGTEIIYGAGFLFIWNTLLNFYSNSKKQRDREKIKNYKQKKTFFSNKAHALFFFGIPATSIFAVKKYVQLNESMADALAVVKGGSDSSAFKDFLYTSYKNSPSAVSPDVVSVINNWNASFNKSTPLLRKIIPAHPFGSERVGLAKHLQKKYPNGIETINEQTIKQLRTDILRYNKVSLCAEYALYAAAGYLTYKTVRMFAEDDLLPYSSRINLFFKRVDRKVDYCKRLMREQVSGVLAYIS